MVSFEQDADGVTVVVRHRDTGKTETFRAAYLVAADGAHSGVRARLGIPMLGRGTFSKSVTIYFRADVAPLLRGRNLSVIYVNNAVLRGFLRFEKPFDSGFLAVNALGDPANPITDVASGLTKDARDRTGARGVGFRRGGDNRQHHAVECRSQRRRAHPTGPHLHHG